MFKEWKTKRLEKRLASLRQNEARRISLMKTMKRYGAMYVHPLSRNFEVVEELEDVRCEMKRIEKKIEMLKL